MNWKKKKTKDEVPLSFPSLSVYEQLSLPNLRINRGGARDKFFTILGAIFFFYMALGTSLIAPLFVVMASLIHSCSASFM